MPRPPVLALAPLLLFVVSACGLGDDGRTAAAEALAEDLAAALSTQELEQLPLEGGGQEQLDEIVSGMAGLRAAVSAADVDVARDAATITLDWRWAAPGAAWDYSSEAVLQWTGDAWSATWTPSLVEPSLAAGEKLVATVEQGRRGDILGAGDTTLVTARSVTRFGIDKAQVTQTEAVRSARALARLLGVEPDRYATVVKGAGARAFVEALVLRARDARAIALVDLRSIPGAVGLQDELPLAPTRDFAAQVLGRVGEATAEIVAESEGSVRPGDEVGLSGLQARYESQLAGTPGVRVAAVSDVADRTLWVVDPVDGQALRTTLDAQLQRAADAALADIEPASALVALRPSSGNILAVASGPGSGGYSTATIGRYAPGSTMKVVTALALMRAGVAADDPVPCTTRLVVDGKPFTNYDGYPPDRLGRIPLQSAVANSCNTALISQRDLLADDDLAGAAEALGLGVDHDLGFPAYFGQVPAPSSETGRAASMIGQGRVLASPLAMATVAATVVEGRVVVPRLLPDQPAPTAAPADPLTAEEAEALRGMMRAVVTEGTARFLADVPDPPVGAKTGTAEFGTRVPPQTHAWMIATQGDLAVAVFVEVGASGSGTAGPILEEFLRAAG